MLIGIDDTDSPQGMCTTYLGAVLVHRLNHEHMLVKEARLIRLNPNVTWKTRGNAAIMFDVEGDPGRAFEISCALVEEMADLSCENTNPGVVVVDRQMDPAFYRKAVTDFCTIREAVTLLDMNGARYKGWKNRRGLIGATAAVASELADKTTEILVYREPSVFGTPRTVNRESLFAAETATFPHTWDTVDWINDVVVCVPHTPDPVLFGIRGESPQWVMAARQIIQSETVSIEQIWMTNQGTDAHLLPGRCGHLVENHSYYVSGTVASMPETRVGGHVSFAMKEGDFSVRCMAYEPTKTFRQLIRQIIPGDEIVAVGSFKKGSINLEKIQVVSLARHAITRPPLCTACNKRMTSNGRDKGYKCKKCDARTLEPDTREISRPVTGWYEVPPTSRRHLAKPLCRGEPKW